MAAIPSPARPQPLPIPVVAAAALVLAWTLAFHDTVAAMARVWWSSASFAHGPLVPVATLWMIWRERERLARLEATAHWPSLVPVVALLAAWIAARLAGVNAAEQFAAVGVLVATVSLVFGPGVVRTLAFPLGFLFFAVPFGTFLVPHLMEMTASVLHWGVLATGIPAYREGMMITLPTGRWSVVESCSGLRYLLAAVPLATFYAWISYRANWKRIAFVGFMLAVAIAGNWLRAYLIVLVGHFSNMTIAVGPDHLVFGWVLFGLIIALPFWIGSHWQDPPLADVQPANRPAARSTIAPGRNAPMLAALVTAVALAFTVSPLSNALRSLGDAEIDLAGVEAMLDPSANGPLFAYTPDYGGGVHRVAGELRTAPGVGVVAIQYREQHRSGEMIAQANRLLPGGVDSKVWRSPSSRLIAASDAGASFPRGTIRETTVSGPTGRFLVWSWYEVDGEVLTSPVRAKLATLRAILFRGSDESIAWFVWTTLDVPAERARERLAQGADRLAGALPARTR